MHAIAGQSGADGVERSRAPIADNFLETVFVHAERESEKVRSTIEKLVQDFRFALRTLSRALGFSIVVILSVPLGFAANATVFSVADGLLWIVLPIKDPGQVLMFSEGSSFSYPDYIDYHEQTKDIFEGGLAAHFALIPASIGGKGDPERVWGQAVSGNFFRMLGVPMVLGRPILEKDDETVGRGRDEQQPVAATIWRRL